MCVPSYFTQKSVRLEGNEDCSVDSVSVASKVLRESLKAILPARRLFECSPITTCNRCGTIKHRRMSRKGLSCCSYMVKLWSGSIFCLSGSSQLFRYVHKVSVGTYNLQLKKISFKADLWDWPLFQHFGLQVFTYTTAVFLFRLSFQNTPWRCSSYPYYIFQLFTTWQLYVWLKFGNWFISWSIRTKSNNRVSSVPLLSSSSSLEKSSSIFIKKAENTINNHHSRSSTPSLSWIFIKCF